MPAHISPEQFLNEYWQKPLLIKNGLPALKDLFCPDDILALATQDEVSARLITQQGQHWTLKNSPLDEQDFDNLPPLWTVLVQNLEAWSGELGQLWQAFDFIPRWQQDDIMVSYAPKGGSVGKHYDDYDVFWHKALGQDAGNLARCAITTQVLLKASQSVFWTIWDRLFLMKCCTLAMCYMYRQNLAIMVSPKMTA